MLWLEHVCDLVHAFPTTLHIGAFQVVPLSGACQFVQEVHSALSIPCRVSKMFEIIVEYPESKPVLLELKVHLKDALSVHCSDAKDVLTLPQIALDHVNYWGLLTDSLSQS